MIATLLAMLFSIFVHLTPAVATVPPAGPAPASDGQQPSTPTSEAPTVVDVDPPACQPGEEWDGLRCVALQLPQETIGREIG